METLLAHSFDYLSSYDPSKIRKGLRQVEGLLAQICLSRSKLSPAEKRRSMIPLGTAPSPPKALSELKDDPAFREFFKLQEGFQWNGMFFFLRASNCVLTVFRIEVAMRLITCLEHLLGQGSNGTNDILIVSALDLIQGILLLHPPSRTLFAREIYMNLLLDLLEPTNCPAIQSATLLTLVTALLDCPANTRTFEHLDGLLTITSLFKRRGTSREVKLKLVEFLYFYLMPEAPTVPDVPEPRVSTPNAALHRSPSKRVGAYSRGTAENERPVGSRDGAKARDNKSTEEKQALLGRYLSNVEDLVEDLKETAPFGGTVY